MKSRQPNRPRGKRKKGTLRFTSSNGSAAAGQSARKAKQFASGIMGKYGFLQNNYLGMLALIFKQKGLLSDKELASFTDRSDRAWVLQLQLQLQSLNHFESAPMITKKQIIQQLQQQVTNSGYSLPKQGSSHMPSQSQEQHVAAQMMPEPVEKPAKKRGRKSKKEQEKEQEKEHEKEKQLAENGLIPSRKPASAIRRDSSVSQPVIINVVNKGNSPIIQRSMRQLAAAIGMLAHPASSKKSHPNHSVNGLQHTGYSADFQRKIFRLLQKQVIRDATNSDHTGIVQYGHEIRVQQDQPSLLQVAKLYLQEAAKVQMNPVPNNQVEVLRQSARLREGSFSEKTAANTVRFITRLLLKHAEKQEASSNTPPSRNQEYARGPKSKGIGLTSLAEGFLTISQQPTGIYAASLTTREPFSILAATSAMASRSYDGWGAKPSSTRVWRKQNESVETAPSQRTLQDLLQEQIQVQGEAISTVDQRLEQQREEIRNLQRLESELEGKRVQPSMQREQATADTQEQEQLQGQALRHVEQQLEKQAQLQLQEPVIEQLQLLEQSELLEVKAEQQDVGEQRLLDAGKPDFPINNMLVQRSETEETEQPLNSRSGRARTTATFIGELINKRNLVSTGSVERATSKRNQLTTNKRSIQPETEQATERSTVTSKRITAEEPFPNQIHRKPAAIENGREAIENIQHHENWLQQIVQKQRQRSPNNPLLRNLYSLQQEGLRPSSKMMRGNDLHPLPPVIKADLDLGITVMLKAAKRELSEPNANKTSDALAIQRKSLGQNDPASVQQQQQLQHQRQPRQAENPVMGSRSGQIEQTDLKLLRRSVIAEFTPALQSVINEEVENPQIQTSKRISKEKRLESELPVAKSKLPNGELALEIAAKVAEANIRTVGPTLTRSVLQPYMADPNKQWILRKPLSSTENRNDRIAGHQREGFAGDKSKRDKPSIPQGITGSHRLAAELAAKTVQSGITHISHGRNSIDGLLRLQHNKSQEKMGQGNDTSKKVVTTSSEGSGGSGGSASIQVNDQVIDVVAGAVHGPISPAPVEIVRRTGAPSPIERVRAQQAQIQRRIESEFWTTRTSNLQVLQILQSLYTHPSSEGENNYPVWSPQPRRGELKSGQLTLRAGQAAVGIQPRQARGMHKDQQVRTSGTSREGQGLPEGLGGVGNASSIQRTSKANDRFIERAVETKFIKLITRAADRDIRQGAARNDNDHAAPSHRSRLRNEAQAEHVQRRITVDGSERVPQKNRDGSDDHLEAASFQMDVAERTIRDIVGAQVEERALAFEPAASRTAGVVAGARPAGALAARRPASMTPRVMPLLASSAGALRAAPAGTTEAAGTQLLQARTGAMPGSAGSRTDTPGIGVSPQVHMLPGIGSIARSARGETLPSPSMPLEHIQAPAASALADSPLEMDWLRTKASAGQEPPPAALVDQAPPELSNEQLQQLVKQIPQLDIAKIAEKVFREIEKKMKFERQRRGM